MDPVGSRGTLWAARAIAFVAFFDLFSQFPVVAPYAHQLGASPAMVGIVVGAYSFANLFGNLAAGPLLDRWGRKPAITLSLVAAAASLVLYTLVQTAEQLVAVRIVHGLAAAVLSPGAFALLSDAARPEARARALGSAAALIAVAAVLGPSLSGIVRERFGPSVVFLGVAVLLLATAAVVAIAVRERAIPVAQEGTFSTFGALLRRRGLLVAFAAIAALTVALGTLVAHLPIQLDVRGEAARASGTAFSVYALVALIGLAGPASWLSDRFGRARPLAAGLTGIGLAMLLLAAVTTMTGVYLAMALFGLGFALLFPAASALVVDSAEPGERGTGFGLFYAVYSAGTVVGATSAGVLAETFGEAAPAPFLLGAIAALLVAPVALVALRKGSEQWVSSR
ncbi:MAG: MFS transporter [Dehalococcoidia bacterium]